MTTLNVQAPDGKTLSIDVPQGTDPSKYGALADDALSHYTTQVAPPSEGGVMSFIRAAGNQMPLGSQFSALVSPGSYSDNMAKINASIAQDKAQHPVAYGAGAVTGAVAPALVPGVGPMMAANPLTTGAILGGTNAVANTDIKKNPVEALAQAGTGAATGALTSGLIAKAAPAVQSSLESQANESANKSMGMPRGVLVDMDQQEQQNLGQWLRDSNLVGADKGKILDKARTLQEDYGSQIGQISRDMTKKGLTVEDPGILTQPLVDKAEQYAMLEDPEANLLYKTYMAGAKAIASKGENPTWQELQGLKETYGPLAFKSTGEVKNQAAADIYFTLSNALKGIADDASNNPEIPSAYRQALSGYSRMSPIVSGLEKTVDSELRGGESGGTRAGLHTLLHSLPRPARLTAGAVATAAGHPYLGLASLIPEMLNPAVHSQVAGGLADAVPTAASLATQGTVRGATNPGTQDSINGLIQQLVDKFNQRRKF